MIDFIVLIGCVMIYLAIGVFLEELLGRGDTLWMFMIWPIPVILALFLYVCVYIPTMLADKVKEKWQK